MKLENLKVVELEAQEKKSIEGGFLKEILTFVAWNHRTNMKILNCIKQYAIVSAGVHNHPLNN
jgi:hypothetical protein